MQQAACLPENHSPRQPQPNHSPRPPHDDEPPSPAWASVQAAILARAARLVRPTGTLVYATCSLLRAENDDQAACRHGPCRRRPNRPLDTNAAPRPRGPA